MPFVALGDAIVVTDTQRLLELVEGGAGVCLAVIGAFRSLHHHLQQAHMVQNPHNQAS
jgi:hypothetical protein